MPGQQVQGRPAVEHGDHPDGVAQQPRGQRSPRGHQAVEAAVVGGEHPAKEGAAGPLLDQRGQAGQRPRSPGSRRPRTAPRYSYSRRSSPAARSRWPGRPRRTPPGTAPAAAPVPAAWPARPPPPRRPAHRSPAPRSNPTCALVPPSSWCTNSTNNTVKTPWATAAMRGFHHQPHRSRMVADRHPQPIHPLPHEPGGRGWQTSPAVVCLSG